MTDPSPGPRHATRAMNGWIGNAAVFLFNELIDCAFFPVIELRSLQEIEEASQV